MENLYDVAKYFLELDGRLGKMRLNRLLFYAQAWHLARHKKPLFKEDFRVWKTGHATHEYVCDACGYRSNDDRVGAMNIRELGKLWLEGDGKPRFEK